MTLQEQSPIIFLLTDGFIPVSVVVFDSATVVKPQNLLFQRNARGSVFNTAGGAFLNDFGEGYQILNLQGHTGWGGEFGIGFAAFKSLEAMFIEYLALREGNSNPGNVRLLFFDTLNLEACLVYPMRFALTRSVRQNPHLYYYDINLVVLADLFEQGIDALLSLIPSIPAPKIITDLTGNLSNSNNIIGALSGSLTSAFSSIKAFSS